MVLPAGAELANRSRQVFVYDSHDTRGPTMDEIILRAVASSPVSLDDTLEQAMTFGAPQIAAEAIEKKIAEEHNQTVKTVPVPGLQSMVCVPLALSQVADRAF